MPYNNVSYERLYRWGYYAALPLVIALIALFQPFAKPPPPNSAAYGCYVANAAPAIRLDKDGMSILQKGFSRFAFHLERHKTAITLTADAPIRADLSNGRYYYSLYHPGDGEFLDFQTMEDGHRHGEFDEARLSMFAMLASDGVDIMYRKTSPERCLSPSSV